MIMSIEIKSHKSYLSLVHMRNVLDFLQHTSCSFQQIESYFNENAKITKDLKQTLSLLEYVGLIYKDIEEKIRATISVDNNFKIVEYILKHVVKTKVGMIVKNKQGYFLFLNYHYYALRNFLIESEVLERNDSSYYKIREEFRLIGDNLVKNKIDINQFREQQKFKEELGEKAEIFVLEYEQNKFPDKEIDHVSPTDVGAGYDIASFIDKNSSSFDKFIEVKCITAKQLFYWTKNEIETAKLLGENYYLYLVSDNLNEKPFEIKNPYKQVYLNKKFGYTEELLSYNVKEILVDRN
ncbi:hypothetical protein G159_19400 [Planococcus glaciei CHR43]|uniref:DUF3883 domain-containing protein n=1 Tax=Planococcus glaciei TaxID=459472 RepID=UPI0003DF2C54|nr:DUF3883 domain-containing protein [Planococcus glaciei]ETP67314.1 hypothetical protein G159_19400 [Planococcus glaciei CHR43]